MEISKKAKITVTGGAGFLGKAVVSRLKQSGYADIFIPRSKDYDLVKSEAVKRMYRDARPEIVIHLAGVVGGIEFNREFPGTLFFDNLMMGTQLIEQARLSGVRKFIAMGSICGYPAATPVPFREENFWNGYPPEDVAAYGIAKKMMLVQSVAYRRQFGFNSIHLTSANLYGPGDKFHPRYSHVIPALVQKVDSAVRSGQDNVTVWGTGTPTRDLLYVDDCAEAVVLAMERYDKSDPVNLGTGTETSVRTIVEIISDLMKFKGRIKFDETMPNGQLRRRIDTSKAEREFGFGARTSIEEGLKKTVEWYLTEGPGAGQDAFNSIT